MFWIGFLFILIDFRIFINTPLWDIGRIGGFLVMILGFYLILIGSTKLPIKRRWLSIFIGMGLLSAVTSTLFFRQTIFDGVVASMFYFAVLGVYPIYILIKKRVITTDLLEKYFVPLFWVNLVLKISLFFFGITYTYTSVFTGVSKPLDGTQFPSMFIQLGMFYYFLKYIKSRKIVHGIFFTLFFLAPQVISFQRMQFIGIVGVLGLILMMNLKRNFKAVLSFCAIIFLVSLTALFFYSSQIDELTARLQESFKIFTGDNDITDTSTLARLYQLEYFKKRYWESPIFGLGMPRPGLKTEIFLGDADEFNYADMGILGILFTHGIIGLIAFIAQCLLVFFVYKRVKHSSLLIQVLYYYLVTITLLSIGTGFIFHSPAHFFNVIIMILSLHSQNQISQGKKWLSDHSRHQIYQNSLLHNPAN